ncbi:MAG: hypothetical protein ACRC4W_02950 [Treponemataceae bacterium]
MKKIISHFYAFGWKETFEKHYITILSVVGFVFTGILVYPFGIHWDNAYVFTNIYTNTLPNNWMGWFYPLFWGTLYKITKIPHIIGIYQNVIYWISAAILFKYLFLNKSKRYFVLFAFFLGTIFFLVSITNNAFLATTVLFSIALWVLGCAKQRKILLLISLLFLLSSLFIRRDAIFLITPILFAFMYNTLSFRLKNIFFKSVLSFFLVVVLLVICFKLEKYHTSKIEGYDQGIKSIELITIFDLTGMSYYKKELLIPDEILKEEYRGENRHLVLNHILKSPDIFNDVITFQINHHGVDEFFLSKMGVNLQMAVPIYLKNITSYIKFRARFISLFFFENNSLLQAIEYDKDTASLLNLEKFPKQKNYFLILTLRLFRAFEYILPITKEFFYLIISFLALIFLNKKQMRNSFIFEERFFCNIFIFANIFSIGITMISAPADQFRYVMPANILIWLVFIYTLSKTNAKKQFLHNLIDKI